VAAELPSRHPTNGGASGRVSPPICDRLTTDDRRFPLGLLPDPAPRVPPTQDRLLLRTLPEPGGLRTLGLCSADDRVMVAL